MKIYKQRIRLFVTRYLICETPEHWTDKIGLFSLSFSNNIFVLNCNKIMDQTCERSGRVSIEIFIGKSVFYFVSFDLSYPYFYLDRPSGRSTVLNINSNETFMYIVTFYGLFMYFDILFVGRFGTNSFQIKFVWKMREYLKEN